MPWSNGLTAFGQPVISEGQATAIPPDVVRFARQTTFGPTPQVINRIAELGMAGWLDEQFKAKGSTYADLVVWVPRDYCSAQSNSKCWQNNFSRYPVAARFYADAALAPDQLRQRVAFALSQILVVSGQATNGTGGLASYQQILLDGAFGNYRDLLGNVTLNGYMGSYLSMAGSSKIGPSENYAREMLQLFTMGPVRLADDGSPVLDSAGNTIPNYTSDDIVGISRSLTGWSFAMNGGRTDWTGSDLSKPMIERPGHYDSNQKTFLGKIVAAGANQKLSVDTALDAAFNNPSTAPNISKKLIQHLVKSNPSRDYVKRVSDTFSNNGHGVRGDLKAVVRAILMDPEARGNEDRTTEGGKVKEPILVMMGIVRAIGLRTDGAALLNRDSGIGQPVFQAPSVFNFYPPDFPLPGDSRLLSPASKLKTAGGITALQGMVYDWTINGESNRGDWNYDFGIPNFTGSQPSWSSWEAVGGDVDRLVSIVNLLMLNNSATQSQKAALKSAAQSIVNKDSNIQARKRAQALLYIAGTSPNFLVDR